MNIIQMLIIILTLMYLKKIYLKNEKNSLQFITN